MPFPTVTANNRCKGMPDHSQGERHGDHKADAKGPCATFDASKLQTFLDDQQTVAFRAGQEGTAGTCGDGIVEGEFGEQCDVGGAPVPTCKDLGFLGGTIPGCRPDCTVDSSGCTNQRFVDSGNGTVTDNQTGLQWEKKDNLDSSANLSDPHDADNTYTWSSSGTAADGTVFTDFLSQLNNCVSADGSTITGGFAGHCDWRLPTIAELQTILLAPFLCGTNPCIDPIFGPTKSLEYWSATTSAGFPNDAWGVGFADGHVLGSGAKSSGGTYARAVRSGL
jgi:uncharacterized protein DUF1566